MEMEFIHGTEICRSQEDMDTRLTELLIRCLERKSVEIEHMHLDGDSRNPFQE